MTKKGSKYPFIIKMYGEYYRLESAFGRNLMRKCDKNGKIYRGDYKKSNILDFKELYKLKN
jgi:hypothetical protein